MPETFPSVTKQAFYTRPGDKTLYTKVSRREGFDNPLSERFRIGDGEKVHFFAPAGELNEEPEEAIVETPDSDAEEDSGDITDFD